MMAFISTFSKLLFYYLFIKLIFNQIRAIIETDLTLANLKEIFGFKPNIFTKFLITCAIAVGLFESGDKITLSLMRKYYYKEVRWVNAPRG